jgi:hypothetical protein
MSNYMELTLEPNGDYIKASWKIGYKGVPSKPLRLRKILLRDRSRDVRKALSKLNAYVRSNPNLSEERDPGWALYSSALEELRECGKELHTALFFTEDNNPRIEEFADALRRLATGAELAVVCSDDEVTLPLGFAFEGKAPSQQRRPSREDFAGFWLDRFDITMLVQGSGCDETSLTVDPESFRTLYALDKTATDDALSYLGDDRRKLKQLTLVDVQDHYDWDNVESAYTKMRETNGVVFVLAHSDGDRLVLSGRKMDCLCFGNMINRGREEGHVLLLVLNCCMSATGGEQRSLLSAVARRGVCGLIGTEAEILNTFALRCGIRLMWELCAEGRNLGEAFKTMQRAEDLFPLNLFYTCYAERDFQLRQPLIKSLAA